jgi:hypothetical protein
MTSESEYRNAVRYLTNLLNGGLMGANLCPHCNADMGGDCDDGYYENPHYERCPVCGQKLDYSE